MNELKLFLTRVAPYAAEIGQAESLGLLENAGAIFDLTWTTGQVSLWT